MSMHTKGFSYFPTVTLVSHTGNLGGAERSLLELACALRASGGAQVRLACPVDGALSRQTEACGVPVTLLPTMKPEGKSNSWARGSDIAALCRSTYRLRRSIAQDSDPILHGNGWKGFLFVPVAAIGRGVPCVWHMRDFPRRRFLEGGLASAASAIVAPSRFVAQALLRQSPFCAGKVRVIPNGVAFRPVPGKRPILREETRSRLGIPGNSLVLLMAAQIVPWKRHDLLLGAASRLVEQGYDSRVLLAGCDWWGCAKAYLSKLERFASESRLRGKVWFLGQHDDMDALYACADVLVLPSDNEPFGRVIVEAWRMGLPVVVSDIGGPAELVAHKDTGLCFRAGDVDSLARTLARLLSDQALMRSLTASGATASERFTPERHAEEVLQLYRELLS